MSALGKLLAIVGVLLQVGPVAGLTVTIVGMINAFGTIEAVDGMTPSDVFAGNIAAAMSATAVGILFAFPGALFILMALFACRYRALWFHKALGIVSLVWLSVFPIGTAAGVALLVYLRKHKSEFLDSAAAVHA